MLNEVQDKLEIADDDTLYEIASILIPKSKAFLDFKAKLEEQHGPML